MHVQAGFQALKLLVFSYRSGLYSEVDVYLLVKEDVPLKPLK